MTFTIIYLLSFPLIPIISVIYYYSDIILIFVLNGIYVVDYNKLIVLKNKIIFYIQLLYKNKETSGFCTYPEFRFNMERVKEFEEEGVKINADI